MKKGYDVGGSVKPIEPREDIGDGTFKIVGFMYVDLYKCAELDNGSIVRLTQLKHADKGEQ